jgi:hypothetical protein
MFRNTISKVTVTARLAEKVIYTPPPTFPPPPLISELMQYEH